MVLLILVIGGYFYLDGKLDRKDILVSYAGQPAAGSGTNWLITGSDSRQGLTRKQERKYHTGIDVSGQRSDTIMLLHIPASGPPPSLVSLPRDSYVPIRRYGQNKLNAALFLFGGPKPLLRRPCRTPPACASSTTWASRVRRPGEWPGSTPSAGSPCALSTRCTMLPPQACT